MKGVLIVNKDRNMTSHDVVSILRRQTNIKRIGHTGTLDPMVTGVLPICIGNATRVSEYIMEQGKEYIGEMTFGSSTTSYDSYGELVDTSDKIDFSIEEIEEAFKSFTGKIKQLPPMYSAVKINGQRLYNLARKGIEIDRKYRDVHIYKLDLLEKYDNKVKFYVKCSKGTYIRSLVHDIAKYMGSLAYMSDLTRVSVGDFKLDDATDINDIKKMSVEEISDLLIPTEESIPNIESFIVASKYKDRLLNGQRIKLNNYPLELEDKSLKVFAGNEFLGIGRIKENLVKMERVLYR